MDYKNYIGVVDELANVNWGEVWFDMSKKIRM